MAKGGKNLHTMWKARCRHFPAEIKVADWFASASRRGGQTTESLSLNLVFKKDLM